MDRRVTLTLLVLVGACVAADRELMNVLSVQIMADLHVSKTLFGLMNGLAFGLFFAGFGIPVAMLADRASRKWILSGAIAIWSAMTALCGSSRTLLQLALTRIAVGVGEAGAVPPTHSLISDLYPAERRARAFSVLATSPILGTFIAIAVGGRLAALWGWRSAFFVFGAAGGALSVVCAVVLREPVRGASETDLRTAAAAAPPLRAAIRLMWQQRSLVHLIAGVTLMSAVLSALATWSFAFLQYSHGIDLLFSSRVLAPTFAAVTICGALLGGHVAGLLERRFEVRWRAWYAAIAMLVAAPCAFATYLTNDREWMLALLFIPSAAMFSAIGPTTALAQTLVPVRMRALSSAVIVLVSSVIGGTFGPFVVGALADQWEPVFGRHSVRYALLSVSVLDLWAALHFARSARTLRADLCHK